MQQLPKIKPGIKATSCSGSRDTKRGACLGDCISNGQYFHRWFVVNTKWPVNEYCFFYYFKMVGRKE